MEDHRDEVVVIAAGYSAQMTRFLAANAGLASRFSRTVEFENYTPDELVTILEQHAKAAGYECVAETSEALRRYFEGVTRDGSFGNGRYARQVLDTMITRQAGRLSTVAAPDLDDMRRLFPADLQFANA
jgi:Holliday junction resolvasome RuvABC ATP-dependent DNA helicase subunit